MFKRSLYQIWIIWAVLKNQHLHSYALILSHTFVHVVYTYHETYHKVLTRYILCVAVSGLAVERPWLALGGPSFSLLCIRNSSLALWASICGSESIFYRSGLAALAESCDYCEWVRPWQIMPNTSCIIQFLEM